MRVRHVAACVLVRCARGGGQFEAGGCASARRGAPAGYRSSAARWSPTTFGIVAASQPLAARAGVQILERGGNAIDAAIAANATIGLMEPTGNGIGGDLFIIYYEAKTNTVHGLNSSGWAPTGFTVDYLASKGITKMPQRGIYSVTVPGVVAGWDAMREKFGTKPLSELLAPAIYYAENGFPLVGNDRRGMGPLREDAQRASEFAPHVFDRREARAEGRRSVSQSRSGRVAAADRREGPRRLLQGQDRRSDSADLARAGRHDDRRGPRGVLARMGHADQDQLSRLERLRNRAADPGHLRADDAEPDGAVPDGGVRLSQHERAARDDRGQEAGLRRHAALRRRSAVLTQSG